MRFWHNWLPTLDYTVPEYSDGRQRARASTHAPLVSRPPCQFRIVYVSLEPNFMNSREEITIGGKSWKVKGTHEVTITGVYDM